MLLLIMASIGLAPPASASVHPAVSPVSSEATPDKAAEPLPDAPQDAPSAAEESEAVPVSPKAISDAAPPTAGTSPSSPPEKDPGTEATFLVMQGNEAALARYPARTRVTAVCLQTGEHLQVLSDRPPMPSTLRGPGCVRATARRGAPRAPAVFRVIGGSESALARYRIGAVSLNVCLHEGEVLRVVTIPQTQSITLEGTGCSRQGQTNESQRNQAAGSVQG